MLITDNSDWIQGILVLHEFEPDEVISEVTRDGVDLSSKVSKAVMKGMGGKYADLKNVS